MEELMTVYVKSRVVYIVTVGESTSFKVTSPERRKCSAERPISLPHSSPSTPQLLSIAAAFQHPISSLLCFNYDSYVRLRLHDKLSGADSAFLYYTGATLSSCGCLVLVSTFPRRFTAYPFSTLY